MVKNIGVDKFLIVSVIFLLLFGLIMIYNATMILAKEKYADSFYFFKKQILWVGVGLILFGILSLLKYPLYLNQKFVFLALVISIIALIMVFFTGKINNSYRWIRLGAFSVQPSEFAKISAIMYLSYLFGKKKYDVNNIKKLIVLLIPIFIIELLILKEPDYGNFFLILLATLIILFVSGFKIKYFLISSVLIFSLVFVSLKLSPERMNRILAYLNPQDYVTTYSFQTMQSIYALGSGGIFGQGLGKSTQKLYFLPYAYTDFIFSIIGEEVGLIGTLLVLGLFFIFLTRGLRIAKQSGNLHTYLLGIGLTFLIVSQALINISVTLGIVPTKGIPLPFISIGGSSMIASLIIAGIIVNISKHRKMVFLND
ncbi:MAG: putative lipid II flippase FtsW [Candidatus Aminicenantes bacterium]|nr:putative lipid II flippase FtsW [Candidatus Aminicenantes bacterium]